MLNENQKIFIGIDTHKDTYAVASCDEFGKVLCASEFSTAKKGLQEVLEWAFAQGEIQAAGIEGTGCYGKNIACKFQDLRVKVVEVNHSCKKTRWSKGKSDTLDAENAALTARDFLLGGVRENNASDAMDRTSDFENIRTIKTAYDGALKMRTQTTNQLKAILIKARPELRDEFSNIKGTRKLINKCASLRPDLRNMDDYCTKVALQKAAKRYLDLTVEIEDYKKILDKFASEHLKSLLELKQVGTISAIQMFLSAGANPERFKNEAAFAAHCGVSPIPASSGKNCHMRLSRAGDRKANSALYTIAIGRMGKDERTKAFVEKKLSEGKTKKDAIRCLKRYICREVFTALKKDAKLFSKNPLTL